MKKLFILSLLLTLFIHPIHSEEDSDVMTNCEIIFNYSKSSICGLDSTSFVKYYAHKNEVSEDFVSMILKRFEGILKARFFSHHPSYKGGDSNNGEYLRIKISNLIITDKAGISCAVRVLAPNGAILLPKDIQVPDGRWNTFEELLYENAEKAADKLNTEIEYKKGKLSID